MFILKKREKTMFGKARRNVCEIFHALARRKEFKVIEGHLMPGHLYMCIGIPPQFPVASIIGFLKEKSAIAVAAALEEGTQFHQ